MLFLVISGTAVILEADEVAGRPGIIDCRPQVGTGEGMATGEGSFSNRDLSEDAVIAEGYKGEGKGTIVSNGEPFRL